MAVVARRLLWASLGLAPITIVVRFVFDPGDVTLFALAALSLIPLACVRLWLIWSIMRSNILRPADRFQFQQFR